MDTDGTKKEIRAYIQHKDDDKDKAWDKTTINVHVNNDNAEKKPGYKLKQIKRWDTYKQIYDKTERRW